VITNIKKLRIDAAGYQASIIDYCFEHDIEFSIRAKMCQSLKDIFVDKETICPVWAICPIIGI
jgi:hypothetical protein